MQIYRKCIEIPHMGVKDSFLGIKVYFVCGVFSINALSVWGSLSEAFNSILTRLICLFLHIKNE